MLETDTQAPPETPVEPESRSLPWWVIALVVVAPVVVAGALVWWLGSSDAGDVDDPQQETATELVDTYNQGVREKDAELAASVFTEDAVFMGSPIGRSGAERAVDRWADVFPNLERVGELTKLSDGVYTFVNQFDRTPLIQRHVLVIELDGELISWIDGISDFYEEFAE